MMPASLKKKFSETFPGPYGFYRRLKTHFRRPQPTDLRQSYPSRVRELMRIMPEDEAMSIAVGGDYQFMGNHLVDVLKTYGLTTGHYLIDVGCGSGRVAHALSKSDLKHNIKYMGTDISEELLRYARKKCAVASWRFVKIDSLKIPEMDDQADVVCFFSVFTHLLPEESYLYLEEARRVVKPNGVILFTFFDFKVPDHWTIFHENIKCLKSHTPKVLDTFLSKDAVEVWAQKLGLHPEYIGSPDGGQARCLLRKPA